MSTCRLCLGYTATMDIFYHDRKLVLRKFTNYSKMKIQKHDGLPEKICLDCILKMEAAVAFITECQDNDRELRSKVRTIKNEKGEDIFGDSLSFSIDEKTDNSTSKRRMQKQTIVKIKEESDNDNTPLLLTDNSTSKRRMQKQTIVKIEEDSDNDNTPLEFLYDDKESDASNDIYQHVYFHNPSIKYNKKIRKKKIPKKSNAKVKNVGHLCNVCGEYFAPTSKLAYKYHMLTHGEKQFKCTKCPKQFFTRRKYTAHGRAHVETKNFSCEYCGKAFKSKNNITMHIQFIHEKKNQYTCEYCKRTFIRPDYFKRHLSEMHRVEQNYVCRTCHKSFPFLNLFQLHQLIHTGEKDFPCNSCPSKFISKKLLTDHQRTHTNELKFHCDICYKGYSLQHHLKTHMTKLHKGSTLDV